MIAPYLARDRPSLIRAELEPGTPRRRGSAGQRTASRRAAIAASNTLISRASWPKNFSIVSESALATSRW